MTDKRTKAKKKTPVKKKLLPKKVVKKTPVTKAKAKPLPKAKKNPVKSKAKAKSKVVKKPKKPVKKTTKATALSKTKAKGRTAPQKGKGKGPGGRPSDYHPEYCEEAKKLCMLMFANDEQLAEYFDISVVTLNAWKKKHPEFLKALRHGKKFADANVAGSLYHRAVGGTSVKTTTNFDDKGEETTSSVSTEEVLGDVRAIQFWLKNRQKDIWRDVYGHTDGQGGALGIHIHECLPDQAVLDDR